VAQLSTVEPVLPRSAALLGYTLFSGRVAARLAQEEASQRVYIFLTEKFIRDENSGDLGRASDNMSK